MKDTKTLYQHGTLGLLVPGLFAGTLTMSELLAHGDTGIGTGDGLDGELILLNGHAYHVAGSGEVDEMSPENTTPFGNAHFYAPTHSLEIEKAQFNELDKIIEQELGTNNLFVGITAHGIFQTVKTRAIDKKSEPFPSLTEASKTQHVFTREQVRGTLVGYYSPELYQGVTSAGCHVHFISDEKDFGGHLLDFMMVDVKLELQPFENFDLHLPTNDETFKKTNFDISEMDASIRSAEGE